MIRLAPSPLDPAHDAEVRSEDVHEPCGWTTYARAVCSCGWRAERTYLSSVAYAEMEMHLVEALSPARSEVLDGPEDARVAGGTQVGTVVQ